MNGRLTRFLDLIDEELVGTRHEMAGRVTPEEARKILSRYNASHFRLKTEEVDDLGERRYEHARYSIPANPKRDDDIRLAAFIRQSEAQRDVMVAEVTRLRDEAGDRVDRTGGSEATHFADMADAYGALLRFLGVETCHLCMDAQKDGDDACYEHTTRSKAV